MVEMWIMFSTIARKLTFWINIIYYNINDMLNEPWILLKHPFTIVAKINFTLL